MDSHVSMIVYVHTDTKLSGSTKLQIDRNHFHKESDLIELIRLNHRYTSWDHLAEAQAIIRYYLVISADIVAIKKCCFMTLLRDRIRLALIRSAVAGFET